jgi:hypothetical protein
MVEPARLPRRRNSNRSAAEAPVATSPTNTRAGAAADAGKVARAAVPFSSRLASGYKSTGPLLAESLPTEWAE